MQLKIYWLSVIIIKKPVFSILFEFVCFTFYFKEIPLFMNCNIYYTTFVLFGAVHLGI